MKVIFIKDVKGQGKKVRLKRYPKVMLRTSYYHVD